MLESDFYIPASIPSHKQRHNPEQSLEGIHHWNQAPEQVAKYLPAQHIFKTRRFIDC
jgi:hypothetical protein